MVRTLLFLPPLARSSPSPASVKPTKKAVTRVVTTLKRTVKQKQLCRTSPKAIVQTSWKQLLKDTRLSLRVATPKQLWSRPWKSVASVVLPRMRQRSRRSVTADTSRTAVSTLCRHGWHSRSRVCWKRACLDWLTTTSPRLWKRILTASLPVKKRVLTSSPVFTWAKMARAMKTA